MSNIINLQNPVIVVIQPEITQTYTSYEIIRFEDDGETIKCLTNLGYVTVYDKDDYPRDGIFELNKTATIALVTAQIQNL